MLLGLSGLGTRVIGVTRVIKVTKVIRVIRVIKGSGLLGVVKL
jgi:hypothetical protein